NLFTGVHGNYLKPSIRAAGLDPDNLPESDPSKMSFGEEAAKPWKDIWGSGQGIGAIKEVTSAAEFVDKLDKEYFEARDKIISRSEVRKTGNGSEGISKVDRKGNETMIQVYEKEDVTCVKMDIVLDGKKINTVYAFLVDGMLIDTGQKHSEAELIPFYEN